MLKRIFLAIVVGVITWLVVYIIGLVLVQVGVGAVGSFVESVAPLVGLLAGLWFYLTGQSIIA